ncbi:hypothetical protein AAC387_Pa02g2305 [Persea americana]
MPPRRVRHDRHRPTASERRCRARQYLSPNPIEESEDDVASQEPTDNDIANEDAHPLIPEERVDEDHQASPIPGGPEDLSVLISFRTRIALSIWVGEDRNALKCVSHWPKLRSWYLPQLGEDNHVPGFHAVIEESGVAPLWMHLSYRHINRALVSAFVKRWRPETNTFHLPFGEMTITLDDVSANIGIPVVGTPVHTPIQLSFTNQISLLECGLGVDRGVANAELFLAHGGVVRLSWIKQMCGDVTPQLSAWRIEGAARGYLFYLLSCTLFVEKSATRVPIFYLELVMDVGHLRHYAWGATALAYLYCQLG